ncbi:MAG: hypothetical protein K2P58_06565 [Hyphomonadaceae bacterium]|nr:hypothetical protein [Hyphomonadaceae bacterium]
MSAHARYAAYTASRCGYGFTSLDGADGYCFEVRDGGGRSAIFAAGAGSPYGLNDARAAALSRDKAFCAAALHRRGVAALRGELFFTSDRWRELRSPGREPADARAYVRRARFPLFCKPIAASNGLFAEIIETVEEFDDYLNRVATDHFAVLVQPYMQAPEHRVVVLNGQALFSYEKRLPQLVGDGETTIEGLALSLHGERCSVRLRAVDANGWRLTPQAVLGRGERAVLLGPANRSAGGSSTTVHDGAASALAEVALAAADALGLRLAAVDMFWPVSEAPMVIEVNSNPMFGTLEDHGRWDLIETIWRANFEAALS